MEFSRIKSVWLSALSIFIVLFFSAVLLGEEKKPLAQLIKDMESPDEAIRKTAADEIIVQGDKAKKEAVTKITKRKDELVMEYTKTRRKALDDSLKARNKKDKDKKKDPKWLENKRKAAMSLYAVRNFEEMKKLVIEIEEAFYPAPLIENEEDTKKLSGVAGKIGIVDDSLAKLGCEAKPDTKTLVKLLDTEIDAEFQWKVMPAKDMTVMEQNKKLKSELNIEEYRMVEMLNKYRVAMGRKAVVINPKLCKAARGHSKDMSDYDFFDHVSPIPGKRTHMQRAALEKTSCSAENIAQALDAAGAFWGWFSSKSGHHEEMFTAEQIGIGFYKGCWTAMF
ncbi:MAG: CAP domain-containing protein [Planctomycetes bacterium]|nr:CAP domain-containing protein [Planctomycetota bacterium]